MLQSTLLFLALFVSAPCHAFAFVPSHASLTTASSPSMKVIPSSGSSTSLSLLPPRDRLPPTNTLSNLPSILFTDEIPEYQTANAFQDTVTLTDLTSDPFLRTAFLLTALSIAALFIAKSIVTQMDEAVQKTAIDFDRVMKLKYSKKWKDIIEMEEELVGAVDREEKEGDRIQRIVEEMERLTKEEPEFFERVMRDVDRQD